MRCSRVSRLTSSTAPVAAALPAFAAAIAAEQAKTALYRLVAAGQVAGLMESPDQPQPANRIDEIIFAKLKTLGIKPALCSDAVFVRRGYLDLTGKLPTAEEAKAFIGDSDKHKRVALIGQLLDRTAHVDYWAMKWSDILRIKAEFPVKLWPNAAQAYYRWVWESLAQNKPYDKFARELLTSSGSNFRVGPVNFYRAIQDKTPEGIAAAVGATLLGARVHLWPADRRAGLAPFFSQVGYKPTSEWKEEIVFWDPLNSTAVPGSTAPGVDSVAKAVTVANQIPQALAKPLSENGPLAAVFPDGAKTTIPPNRDPREVFAEWLIRPENPWFARAIANRTWAWAMGRGIIHEPDDVREDNPPSNPELLAYLEKELVASGYDLKHLNRLIFTSTAYQFSSIPRFTMPEARANFASYPLRRVEAEVLIDALNAITGSSDLYTSAVPEPFTYIPKDISAVALADGSITSPFLTLFGRSARATGMEAERVNELASPQWLHMLNSATIQSKLQNGPKLAALVSAGGTPKEIAERLYLAILSRFPTEGDLQAAEEHAKAGLTKAFALDPTVLCLLTDGDPGAAAVKQVADLNKHHVTVVHTFAFGSSIGAGVLREIAAANGGAYRFVGQPRAPSAPSAPMSAEDRDRLDRLIGYLEKNAGDPLPKLQKTIELAKNLLDKYGDGVPEPLRKRAEKVFARLGV